MSFTTFNVLLIHIMILTKGHCQGDFSGVFMILWRFFCCIVVVVVVKKCKLMIIVVSTG